MVNHRCLFWCWMLMMCWMLLDVPVAAQFTNIRIFKGFNKGTKPLSGIGHSRKNDSPIRRVSMATLMDLLQKKPSNPVNPPKMDQVPQNESLIRRIIMPIRPTVYSKVPPNGNSIMKIITGSSHSKVSVKNGAENPTIPVFSEAPKAATESKEISKSAAAAEKSPSSAGCIILGDKVAASQDLIAAITEALSRKNGNISSAAQPTASAAIVTSLVKSTEAAKPTSSPLKAASAAVKPTSSPVKAAPSPVKAASTAVKPASLPVKAAPAAVKLAPAPVKAASAAPLKAFESIKRDGPIGSKLPAPSLKIGPEGLRVNRSEISLLPNSPIYYIKLPAHAYSFVPGKGFVSRTTPAPSFPLVHLSVDFNSNGRPSNIYLANDTLSSSSSLTTAAPTTIQPETSTDSRIIYIKGPFTFNGKPENIYSSSSPYRPPNYFEILHQLYPKLKRAQLIR